MNQAKIRELFRLFDANNDRSISSQELGKAMRFLGMTPTEQQVTDAMRTLDVDRVAIKNLGETLTDKELDDMMRQADIDGDGKIHYEDSSY
ncbi:uncharacterized protein LOC127857295 [Dreissena polymorpha]|uniref:EF-hand domain-containing protein n=1 Tax=Dreissena polymorpha TaxID=45954 RepID=A0A9D3Z3G3_DREPO|nr:uncharacterized protein LOC127857295 [Dreissena polymorpha]KAH3709926.1 hypothetical protein DPMN_069392 [Dreissena polymorpha]